MYLSEGSCRARHERRYAKNPLIIYTSCLYHHEKCLTGSPFSSYTGDSYQLANGVWKILIKPRRPTKCTTSGIPRTKRKVSGRKSAPCGNTRMVKGSILSLRSRSLNHDSLPACGKKRRKKDHRARQRNHSPALIIGTAQMGRFWGFWPNPSKRSIPRFRDN